MVRQRNRNIGYRNWSWWHIRFNGRTCSGGTGVRASCNVVAAISAALKFFPRSPVVASNTSKTARASVRAGQSAGGALSVLGEYKYLIPLANGRFAYVRNLTNGKTAHLKTDSEAFVEEIRVLAAAGHGAKIRSELNALDASFPNDGWGATEKRLIDAGVFEG
jgi:hypothetical protein